MQIIGTGSDNGGDSIPVNGRDLDFGYLLPLELGTNVIVFTASNLTREGKIVVRSADYRAAITSPTFGEFANGRELGVSGTVSAKYAEGTEEELGLAGVSVNGVAADLDWSAATATAGIIRLARF